MTDATAAPVEETPATPATPTGESAADDGKTPASATDAAKSAEASASAEPGKEEPEEVPELTALTKEQRKTLGDKLNKLDPEARKVFNQLLDGKLQETAAERKAREAAEAKYADLAAFAEIAKKIESDPEGSIAQLQAKFVKPKPGTPAAVSPELVSEIESTMDEASRPLAKVIAPVLQSLLDARLKPIEEREKAAQEKAQETAALSAIESFSKESPDWKTYEKDMSEIAMRLGVPDLVKSGKLQPVDVLRITYTLASSEAKQKAATKTRAEAILEKVAKGAANAEPDTPSVSPARVAKKLTGSVAEAYAQTLEELSRGELPA